MHLLNYFVVASVALVGSSVWGVTVKSLSDARQEYLMRQIRQSAPNQESNQTTIGQGIFGNETIIFSVPSCFMMETTGVYVTAQSQTSSVKVLNARLPTTPTVSASCSPDTETGGNNDTKTANVDIDFGLFESNETITKALISMIITKDNWRWQVTNMTFTVHFKTADNRTECNDVPMEYRLFATSGNSFYCPEQYRYPFHSSGSRSDPSCPLLLTLSFENLIMEPFANGTLFSEVESCEYAFTTPLWMGVATALMMGIILFLGISMLTSIKTMDRFDDPKTSKLLSVPNE